MSNGWGGDIVKWVRRWHCQMGEEVTLSNEWGDIVKWVRRWHCQMSEEVTLSNEWGGVNKWAFFKKNHPKITSSSTNVRILDECIYFPFVLYVYTSVTIWDVNNRRQPWCLSSTSELIKYICKTNIIDTIKTCLQNLYITLFV